MLGAIPKHRLWLVSILPILLFCSSCTRKESSSMAENSSVNLPQKVGAWTRADGPRRVGPREIFDYMDGAGELYLGYRFKFLDVYHYAGPDQNEILVELYWMETAEDAYGLLSGDWGGEAIDPGSGATLVRTSTSVTAPPKNDRPRALYGAGLLRMAANDLFARVMANAETEQSRKAVLALGQAVAAGRPVVSEPALMRALPRHAGGFDLRGDRATFLRSHLVLNSVYFLSSENLLDLGPACELAAGAYASGNSKGGKLIRLLLVRYPGEPAAEKALAHFRQVYLPEKHKSSTAVPPGHSAVFSIEDGWVGFALTGRSLALVFESPAEQTANVFLNEATNNLNELK